MIEMFQRFPLRCCKDNLCDCCLNEAEITNKYINRELKKIRERNRYEGKVILLGNAEAGKSTFLKQMRFMHGQKYRLEEKRRLIPFINRQILSVMRCICQAMQTLGIPFENPRNKEYACILSSSDGENDDNGISKLSPRMVEAIVHIWSDEGVKLCYYRRREYRLTDSAKYFLDSIERISENNYIPNDDDILRVRIPTTGIVQENFHISHYRLQIVDVGGQKLERRKWIYCFDNVTTIIFLASLIEYDQYIGDDPSNQNLMEESLALFRVILSSYYFCNASVILFLNKTDLFPERLAAKPLRYTYPKFNGADNDIEAAKEFIKKKYLNVVPTREGVKRDVDTHFTCSVDRKNIQIIFDEVKDNIFDGIINRLYPYN